MTGLTRTQLGRTLARHPRKAHFATSEPCYLIGWRLAVAWVALVAGSWVLTGLIAWGLWNAAR